MGVDWYPCSSCRETFSDCGEYGWCACGDKLCGYCWNKFQKKYGRSKDIEYGTVSNGCDDCQLVDPSDITLLAFALHKLSMTESDLAEELRAAVRNKSYDLGLPVVELAEEEEVE